MQIYDYIAKQLNDHENQCHGTKQGSYKVWSLDHIQDAVQLGLEYMYSIHPKAFPTQIVTIYQKEDSCVIDFSCTGCKVIEVLRMGHNQCDNTTKQSAEETNNLLPLLNSKCIPEQNPEDKQYSVRELSDNLYLSDSLIPEDTPIDFVCSQSPGSLEDVPGSVQSEYRPLIINFALWQLLLIDNESRTNQPRWEAYFNALKLFVETKLLMEFSLKEDDYLLGRRKVDDE